MRSVKATKKITKAMELISASRIVKAQQRVAASTPYANELTRAVSAVATFSTTNHPLTTASENPKRAAVLIISADRGMAGAYSNNAIKEGEQLAAFFKEHYPIELPPKVIVALGVLREQEIGLEEMKVQAPHHAQLRFCQSGCWANARSDSDKRWRFASAGTADFAGVIVNRREAV